MRRFCKLLPGIHLTQTSNEMQMIMCSFLGTIDIREVFGTIGQKEGIPPCSSP